jgi:hypothetical protein
MVSLVYVVIGTVLLAVYGIFAAMAAKDFNRRWSETGDNEFYESKERRWRIAWMILLFDGGSWWYMAKMTGLWIASDFGGRSDLWIIPFGCAIPAMLVTWKISGFWPERWSKCG